MASISVPITVNLPDNWLEMLFDRAKEDGVFLPVIRCKDCKWYGLEGCPVTIVEDAIDGETIKPSEDDYCSFAEFKEPEATELTAALKGE